MLRQSGFFISGKLTTFKKCAGQSVFEYFVLFIIFAFICFAGMVDLRNHNPDSRFVNIQGYIYGIANTAINQLNR